MDSFQNNVVPTLPDITEVPFKNIDKNYLKVILINFFLVFLFFLGATVALNEFVFPDEFDPYVLTLYIIIISFFGLIFMYFLVSFPRRKFALRDKDISYKTGVFIKTLTTVPFSRIQHVEIDEKPVSRIFGLAAISVYTAGDSSDDLVVKGIKKVEALQIKEFITNKING